ncbi:brain factor-2, partial [Conidiobolus coronatus NRRL 28638]
QEDQEKPPFSYSQLITRAILESPQRQLLLSEIYEWMVERFPYFRKDTAGVWKNSVRHNLSVNKIFKRAPRQHDQPGKGSYWTLDQEQISMMDRRGQRR